MTQTSKRGKGIVISRNGRIVWHYGKTEEQVAMMYPWASVITTAQDGAVIAFESDSDYDGWLEKG